MKKKPICVISVSGGMDSTSLLIKKLSENYSVHILSFNYGQKHALELEKLKININYLISKNIPLNSFRIIDLKDIFNTFESSLISGNCESVPKGHYESESMKSTVVPNRNAIFSSIIYGHALSIAKRENSKVEICLGVHSGDHAIYPDCTPSFYESLNKSFSLGNWDSELISFSLPYIDLNKTLILKDCIVNCEILGIDFYEIMKNTLTSYNPDIYGRASGESGSDIERIEAFLNLGLKDPAEYTKTWEEIVINFKNTIKNARN